MQEYAVEMRGVTKIFPGTLANDNISFSVKPGEIFALVGENGAGKSTVMNVLYGLLSPTEGEVFIHGKKVHDFSPENSIQMGVGMVHQHFKLVPSFTVAENTVLGNEPRKAGIFFDKKAAIRTVEELVSEYGLEVDPTAKVADLSVGMQQRVEILKTLSRGADILILDEPTAVLTPQETEELFAVIRRLAHEKDCTVIIITHKLYEVIEISDRVGVMRKGRLVGIRYTKSVTETELATMMVGREVLFDEIVRSASGGDCVLEADDIYVSDNRNLPACRGISFKLHSCEILGIAGVEGNGQSELTEAVTGMRRINSGSIKFDGKDVTGFSPRALRKMGLAYVPEDRLKTGLAPGASIAENLLAGKQRSKRFALFGIHSKRKNINEYAKEKSQDFDIRSAGVSTDVLELSGGNMQKVVIGREFSFENTKVLIIAQPTRGIDVGAIEFIHKQIMKKRNEGCAILLISADLDEILRLSDRVITLFEGKITAELTGADINKETVGKYMLGNPNGGLQ